ncbi:hypothetical protein [Paenarthrobacter sp.]|uniref:hypothetical protein n=1 Tax=Paenarthrobacter sp. TaxID=1931993 RepID=UPI0028118F15|nr:hypothetical protein [Paenarthrobacter sp.]
MVRTQNLRTKSSVGMRNVPWDNIGIDDEHAAWQATQHLLGLGHWDLAVLSSNEHSVVTETPRFRGFKRALDDHLQEPVRDRPGRSPMSWFLGLSTVAQPSPTNVPSQRICCVNAR